TQDRPGGGSRQLTAVAGAGGHRRRLYEQEQRGDGGVEHAGPTAGSQQQPATREPDKGQPQPRRRIEGVAQHGTGGQQRQASPGQLPVAPLGLLQESHGGGQGGPS